MSVLSGKEYPVSNNILRQTLLVLTVINMVLTLDYNPTKPFSNLSLRNSGNNQQPANYSIKDPLFVYEHPFSTMTHDRTHFNMGLYLRMNYEPDMIMEMIKDGVQKAPMHKEEYAYENPPENLRSYARYHDILARENNSLLDKIKSETDDTKLRNLLTSLAMVSERHEKAVKRILVTKLDYELDEAA